MNEKSVRKEGRAPTMIPRTMRGRPLPTRLRFLLYCHDTFGLGHVRRTLALAGAITADLPGAEVLVVTGSPIAHAFTLPPRVDYLKLPSVSKLPSGGYQPRTLDMEFNALRDLRATLLLEATRAYAPNVFLVDHAPRGMQGEAMPALRYLRASQPGCLCVLGLRDIVDERHTVRRSWIAEHVYPVLEQAYDMILVYGSRALYDVAVEYALPAAVTERLHYCGYLDRLTDGGGAGDGSSDGAPKGTPGQTSALGYPPSVTACCATPDQFVTAASEQQYPGPGPHVLVTVGGGGDGFPLLRAYLEGLRGLTQPAFSSLLLAGPLMEADDLRELQARAAELPPGCVRITPFVADPLPLLRAADLVISMAGYNSVCELLALRQRILFVPRIAPRLEQLVRAEMLAGHGLAHLLHPDALTPAALMRGVEDGLAQPRPTARQLTATGIGFGGQREAVRAIAERLSTRSDQQRAVDSGWSMGSRSSDYQPTEPLVLRSMS